MRPIPEDIIRNNTLCHQAIRSGQYELPSYPNIVFLDTGNICNQFCTFCQSMKAHQKPIALRPEDYEGFDWLKYVEHIFFSGNYGDVLANKHFHDICRTVKRQAPHATYCLWTNGLGLHGDNLTICTKLMSRIYISQNAVSEGVYNTVIRGGNYRQSRKNLEELGKKRSKHLYVTLMMVLVKETAHELPDLINLAADLGFQAVKAHHGEYTPVPKSPSVCLPPESFLDDYSAYFSTDSVHALAQERGIDFSLGSYKAYEGNQSCFAPYNQAYLGILRNRPAFDVCCASLGRPLLFAEKFNNFRNFEKYWNHPRVQEVRQWGNNPEHRHPMCARCKESKTSAVLSLPTIRNCITKYRLKNYDEWGFQFFDDITL